jgi:hypothetical protein
MNADHKEPLVKEYYQTGTIDKAKDARPVFGPAAMPNLFSEAGCGS